MINALKDKILSDLKNDLSEEKKRQILADLYIEDNEEGTMAYVHYKHIVRRIVNRFGAHFELSVGNVAKAKTQENRSIKLAFDGIRIGAIHINLDNYKLYLLKPFREVSSLEYINTENTVRTPYVKFNTLEECFEEIEKTFSAVARTYIRL